ncbi:MAG: hypothetical protein MHPSP_003007 [Paramarteilia canceri]
MSDSLLVKAVSLQDLNQGGRIWVAKLFDARNKEEMETSLLSINSQRISLTQKSMVEGCFEQNLGRFIYTSINNYLLVVVVAHRYNLIRQHRLIKALRIFNNDLIPAINAETLADKIILLSEGWNEIIIDHDFVQMPYSTSYLLNMFSANEQEFNKKHEMLQKMRENEFKEINKAKRKEKVKNILREVKKGVGIAISEFGIVEEEELDSFVGFLKKTKIGKSIYSAPIQSNYLKNDEIIPDNLEESELLNITSNKPQESIKNLMKSKPTSLNSSKNIIESKPVDFTDKIKLSELLSYKIDKDENVLSSNLSGYVDFRYKLSSPEISNVLIEFDPTKTFNLKNMKPNPKVKILDSKIVEIPVEKNKKTINMKLLKWQSTKVTCPLNITPWINYNSAGIINDVMLEITFPEPAIDFQQLELKIVFENSFEDPTFDQPSVGAIEFHSATKTLIWFCDHINSTQTQNITLEIKVPQETEIVGKLTSKYENKTDASIPKVLSVMVDGNKEKVDIDVERKLEFKFVL